MRQGINLQFLIMDSFSVLRRNQVLLLPEVMSISLSMLAWAALTSGLDPEMVTDIESLASSPEIQRVVIIGFAVNFVLTSFAYGVTTAMARVFLEKGSTSMVAARQFVSARFVSLLAISLILGLSTFLGLFVLLLPGLVVTLLLMYAVPAFVMGEGDPLGAVQKSISLVRDNFRDSLQLFLAFAAFVVLLSIAQMILLFIPFLGVFLVLLITSAYIAILSLVMLRAYIALTRKADPGSV